MTEPETTVTPLTAQRARAAIRIVGQALQAGEMAVTYSELARRLGMSKVNGQGLNSYLIQAAAICGFKQPPCLEDLLEPPGLELPWGFRQLVCLEDRLELPPFGGFRLPPGLEDLELSPVPCSSFRADVDAFMPSLLGALSKAASAAGRKAAALNLMSPSGSEMAARACKLQDELKAMVSTLNKNYMKDGVERALARAIEDCRTLGFNEVETPLYDAFMAACCRHIDIAAKPIDPAHPAFRDHRITKAHPLGRMIVAAFARDFGPGSGQDLEDLALWSRILGARYHVYHHPGQPIETSRTGRRRRVRRVCAGGACDA